MSYFFVVPGCSRHISEEDVSGRRNVNLKYKG